MYVISPRTAKAGRGRGHILGGEHAVEQLLSRVADGRRGGERRVLPRAPGLSRDLPERVVREPRARGSRGVRAGVRAAYARERARGVPGRVERAVERGGRGRG